ncbi:response regulator [Gillisia sp. M10.2A]|uniref:histidine kinase n=1 Tax=Gillisia lutea TaxID=2909668 RepID=A0ABS9EHT7_9FLAO|nr:response regulator [Gillisia lutea]MCF4100998.1 response regulator [Gillisia lutea]
MNKDYLDSLYGISVEYLKKYEYKDAIEQAIDLLDRAEKQNNAFYSYRGHSILGNSYQDLNDTLRAKKHYEDALRYALKLQNDTILLYAYNNLGNVYSEDKETTQLGIDYYEKVINLAIKAKIPEQLFMPTVNIAWTYIDNNKFDKAWPYLERGWELFGEQANPSAESQLNYLTGKYYHGKKNFNNAKDFYEKAISLVENNSLLLEGSLVYSGYSKLWADQGDFEQAYDALEKYNFYKSQIFEKEKLRQIQAASVKFDVGEYQRDLEIAKNEQLLQDEVIKKSHERMVLMVISSVVLVIILFLFYRINRSRRKLILELSEKNNELVAAKEEAERLSVLKTRFFSTISHELRTPLYGVIGLTSILLEDKSLLKHENDLKSLKFSADYLLALINDVLQMNKMESNLLKLESLPFNLNDLMRSIVKSFEFTRLQNKNTIHLHIDPNISKNLLGDPVRLSQVLMNLVGNAMKFTERGNIWIKASLIKEYPNTVKVYIEVKDDGLGIPEQKQQIVFEEFSQLKSANYNYQGTGLGLPIVKKLLLLFDSEIHLESAEGKGSSFSFIIEFEKNKSIGTEQTSVSASGREIELKTKVAGKRVLIVDDNRINQVVTKRILEKKFFECDICDNGLDAVSKAREGRFDLILMDVNMPGISGLEATKKIRAYNTTVPVIALTAVEIEEIREDIYESGMNDIIVKPYDTAAFYQVIYRNIRTEILSH